MECRPFRSAEPIPKRCGARRNVWYAIGIFSLRPKSKSTAEAMLLCLAWPSLVRIVERRVGSTPTGVPVVRLRAVRVSLTPPLHVAYTRCVRPPRRDILCQYNLTTRKLYYCAITLSLISRSILSIFLLIRIVFSRQ